MKKYLIPYLFLMAAWMPVNAGNCCCDPCGGPLKPCQWTASIRGGAEWMWYPEERRNDYLQCVAASVVEAPIDSEIFIFEQEVGLIEQVETVRTPNFTDQFSVPWTIVADIGYAVSCNTEVFADFHYGRANGKETNYLVEFEALAFEDLEYRPAEVWNFNEAYTDLKYFGGTIGMRHYFDPICCKFYPFLGVKAGVRHFDPVRANVAALLTVDETEEDYGIVYGSYYDSYNVVHGGFQLGISLQCGDCMSFFVMAEVLGTCGLKPHKSGFSFVTDGGVTDSDEIAEIEILYTGRLNVPARETFNIISIPITAGVQINF